MTTYFERVWDKVGSVSDADRQAVRGLACAALRTLPAREWRRMADYDIVQAARRGTVGDVRFILDVVNTFHPEPDVVFRSLSEVL